MRQTLREQKKDLDILLDVAQAIQTIFVAEIDDSDAHIPIITQGKYASRSMLKKKDQRCVDLAIQHMQFIIFFVIYG